MQYYSIIIATLISSITCTNYPEYPSGETPIEKPQPGCDIFYNGVCCEENKTWDNQCHDCEKGYYWDGKCHDNQEMPNYPSPPTHEPMHPSPPSQDPTYPAPPTYNPGYPNEEYCKKNGLLNLDLGLSIQKVIDLNINFDILKKCKLIDLNLNLGKDHGSIIDLNPTHEQCQNKGLIDLDLELSISKLIDLDVNLDLLKKCKFLNADINLNIGNDSKKPVNMPPTHEECKKEGLLDIDLGLSVLELIDLKVDLDLLKKCKLLDVNLNLNVEKENKNPIYMAPTYDTCKEKGLIDLDLGLSALKLIDLNIDLDLLNKCKLLDVNLNGKLGKEKNSGGILNGGLINLGKTKILQDKPNQDQVVKFLPINL